MAARLLKAACLLVIFLVTEAPSAEPLTSHPIVSQLTSQGFVVGDGERVLLTKPLVTPDMSAEAQRAALEKLFTRRKLSQYLRRSVVAPMKLSVTTVDATMSDGAVRKLDLWFVVHGDLRFLHKKGMAGDVLGAGGSPPASKGDFETYAERMDSGASKDAPLAPLGKQVTSVSRYRFPILEKVIVSGLVQGDGLSLEKALIESIVTPLDKLDDAENPTVWQAIPRGAKRDDQLGPATPYYGFVGYLQVTELTFQPGALLVECHGAFAEPRGWFGGKNLLASKLPLVAQQNVRDFRRKLKKMQAEEGH